ncbi:Gfo/Idh/MocA family oxidoreductase [Actinacidiphila sp. bgisy144]|uniref:Gfo/Idh/MocA family oxidoreductase n=1 Tax=Actinacidiphila sp. bgisy144 TaxID=3413791 RepID=UPI003EB9D1B2
MLEMLRTLVVGLGRAGAGLHLPVLAKARARQDRCFAPEPVVGYDQDPAARARHAGAGRHLVASLAAARRELDPERTVVHVCTPPVARVEVVSELLRLGFRKLLLEKPLAAGPDDLARLLASLRQEGLRPDLRTAVVAPWLASTLTDRLAALVAGRGAEETQGPRSAVGVAAGALDTLGALRQISVVQDKPRFQRSLATSGHPTAFDVEVPHALGVLLRLAGDAEVVSAGCTDLRVDGRCLPRLGGATLALAHRGGVRSVVRSDLTSPVRERRITLLFEHGTAVGHYPADSYDRYAQLRLTAADSATERREVFRDEALTEFMLRAYAYFGGDGPCPATVEQQARVVELLGRAKELAAAAGAAASPSAAPSVAAAAAAAEIPLQGRELTGVH